eukprot:3278261-Prymnesium_polylepis.1
MHEDVEDARRWAVESGLAYAHRIAIMGGSWGGYLALGGATHVASDGTAGMGTADGPTPQPRYAAVVAIVPLVTVGAANTSAAFRSDPLVKQYWRQLYGRRVATNLDAAGALSPLYRVEHLHAKTRVLLVHGSRDPRVPREHGDAIAAAMRRRGVEFTHLIYDREGHSIRREANMLHLWHRVEQFLCAALALPPPPPLDELRVAGHTCHVAEDCAQLEANVEGEQQGVGAGAGRSRRSPARRRSRG